MHIKAVQGTPHDKTIVWVCDPMHGNTRTSENGLKTRHTADIVTEISRCIEIHSKLNSRLGGIHLEMTGELNDEGFSVTECLGGSMELGDSDLSLRYQVGRAVPFVWQNAKILADILRSPTECRTISRHR